MSAETLTSIKTAFVTGITNISDGFVSMVPGMLVPIIGVIAVTVVLGLGFKLLKFVKK